MWSAPVDTQIASAFFAVVKTLWSRDYSDVTPRALARIAGARLPGRYLAELDRLSPRVQVDVIGETTQGRPLNLVKMGAPAPKTQAQAQRGGQQGGRHVHEVVDHPRVGAASPAGQSLHQGDAEQGTRTPHGRCEQPRGGRAQFRHVCLIGSKPPGLRE